MTAKKAEAYREVRRLRRHRLYRPRTRILHLRRRPFNADPYNTGFKVDSARTADQWDTDYETGNMGHRPRTKGGYFPVPPIDSAQDIRSEMLTVIAEMGVTVEKHHHEVALPSTNSA
jgi:glutamine synthetase